VRPVLRYVLGSTSAKEGGVARGLSEPSGLLSCVRMLHLTPSDSPFPSNAESHVRLTLRVSGIQWCWASTGILFFAPTIGRQPLRLVHVQHRDHEENHKATDGVTQITPELAQLCTIRIACQPRRSAHAEHALNQYSSCLVSRSEITTQ
jgi:hypothetical protein